MRSAPGVVRALTAKAGRRSAPALCALRPH